MPARSIFNTIHRTAAFRIDCASAGLTLSTGELQWCTLADDQPHAVITASGVAYNDSFYVQGQLS